jgi:hypothetical protein
MSGPIENYLAELETRLPAACRRRFLREAEEHLRDGKAALVARGADPAEAERRAIEGFGPVDVVATRMAWEGSVLATRRGTVLALAALLLLFIPLYAIPENTFGPAEWATKPTVVGATQLVAVTFWLAAMAVGASAVAAAFLERPRAAAALLATAGGLGFATGVAVLVAGAVWLDHAPWTPLWSALGLVVPATIVLVGVTAGALAWIQTRRPRLERTTN